MKKKSFFNEKILPLIKNKYIIALLSFALWMLVFDDNNLISRYNTRQKIKELENEKTYYISEIKKNRESLNELMSNTDNLEKFAREKYLFKRDNEDIFVFVEDDKK